MEEILEILKYTLPSVVVMLTAFLTLKHFSKIEKDREDAKIFIENNKQLVPMKMQAYERIILLLERISPESLALRLNYEVMSARQLQILMVQTIRKEYDHNISQQVYVSSATWGAVRNAKESIVKIINLAGSKVSAESKSIYLNQEIMRIYTQAEITPVQSAIDTVKSEIRKQFG